MNKKAIQTRATRIKKISAHFEQKLVALRHKHLREIEELLKTIEQEKIDRLKKSLQ